MRKLLILTLILSCTISAAYIYGFGIETKPYSVEMEKSNETTVYLSGDSLAATDTTAASSDTSDVYYYFPNTTAIVTGDSPGDDSLEVKVYLWQGEAKDTTDAKVVKIDSLTVSDVPQKWEIDTNGMENFYFTYDGLTDNGDSSAVNIRLFRSRYK